MALKAGKTRTGKLAESAPNVADKANRAVAPLRAFAWWVALPAVLVYLAVCAVTFLTLTSMSDEINRVDAARGKSAVTAAATSMLTTLSEAVADEATWNEAYLNTYVELNPAWLDTTWGSTARIGLNYDNVIVTDGGGAILFGERSQGALAGNIGDHFAGAVRMMNNLNEAVAASGDEAVVADFSRNEDGLAALSAAVIHRSTAGDMTVPSDRRRILWLARHITPTTLSDIASRFQVVQPVLADAPDPAQQSVPLLDPTGATIGALNWQPSRPGDPALRHAASLAGLALAVIGGLILFLLRRLKSALARQADVAAENWRLARYDPLTGLLSRYGILEHLEAALTAGPTPMPVAMAHVGVEGTASYTAQRREEVLRELAELLKSKAPHNAKVARLDSDQFALGFTGEGAGDRARSYADDVIATTATPLKVGNEDVQLRLNIGVTESALSPGLATTSLRLAEQAMIAARAALKTVPDTAAAAETRQRRMKLAGEIRRALDKDEFDLDYQPIVDFSSQSIFAVEALLRWKRRPDGALDPIEFMDAAMASGFADELGILTLRRAAREIGPLGTLLLCINVATQQFRNPNLAEQIEATLAATRFPASRLQLEITESLLHDYPDLAIATIGEMRAHGVAVALDDFGIGHSSLSHLQKFGIDRVKLDRHIVDQIDTTPAKFALAQGIMTIANALKLKVTAEGVERREEAAALSSMGCREFQGYLFARPMTYDALKRLLEPQLNALKAG